MAETLQQTVDRVLIEGLPQSLKDTIQDALARGVSRKAILKQARQRAGKHATTLGAIEAYLDSLER